MNIRLIAGLLGFGGTSILLAGLIAACAPDTRAPTLQPRQQPVATEEAGVAVVLNVTPASTLKPFTDQACLECHTDQARLVELAVEDAPTETLSEGPG